MSDVKVIDTNALLYYHGKVKEMLGGKVDKVTGKALSTNDFTDAYATKLQGIESGADVNLIESISVNNVNQSITSKNVNITVPTNNNQLTNGAGYQTSSDVSSAISTAIADKVDKVTGKGLSTNDFTDAYETKLDGIEASADVNLIESISVNNTNQTITNKNVNITVPTNNNQLTNGAGYQTASDVSSAISTALSGITGFSFSVENSLPASGTAGTIYLIAHSHGTNDGYDEYIWVNNAFEKLGHTDIDLSGYIATTDVVSNAEIDTILAT